MSNALTEYERKTLTILRDHGPFSVLSQIGYKLFEEAKEGRKPNPSPQGMALAAGRYTSPLKQRGLIYSAGGYSISPKGRELLAELEQADSAQAPLA
jgi:hypothetical protein